MQRGIGQSGGGILHVKIAQKRTKYTTRIGMMKGWWGHMIFKSICSRAIYSKDPSKYPFILFILIILLNIDRRSGVGELNEKKMKTSKSNFFQNRALEHMIKSY